MSITLGSSTIALGGLAALSLSLSLPAHANTPGEEWSSLDAQLETLSSELAPQGTAGPDGFEVNGVFRANYSFFEETPVPGGMGQYSGFAVDNARLWLSGAVGDFDIFVEVEGAGGALVLLDAHATWNVQQAMRVTVGQFQPRFLRSSLVLPQDLIMILRTRPGQLWFDARDQGVRFDADLDQFRVTASLENGGDAQGDELAYTVRGEFDAMGGDSPMVEGAYGTGDGTRLTIGAGFHGDESAPSGTDADVIAIDVNATSGRFSFYGEWVDFGADGGLLYGALGDTSPWSATASFMLDEDTHEVALRYEDWDVMNDITAITLGINRYLVGHDAKFLLNLRSQDSDLAAEETFAVGLGMTASI